jgi:hypothetical protein
MKKANISFGLATLIVLAAATTRLLPHPYNFTAIGALALFGGAHFSGRNLAWMIPFTALFLSDVILNTLVYHSSFSWHSSGTYVAFAMIYLIGKILGTNNTLKSVFAGSLAASLVFFLITNLICWQSMAVYTKDMAGLLACFTAALPFFWNTLAGDLTYAAIMFGAYNISVRQLKLA